MFLILWNTFFGIANLIYGISALKGQTYSTLSKDAQKILAVVHIALGVFCMATIPILIFLEMY